MKLRFLLPFYFLLATITFCSRKASDEKDVAVKDEKVSFKSQADVPGLSGTLELDTVTNTIYADVWLKVSNPDFKYADDFMEMQTKSDYRGIAFRYFDVVNNKPDNGADTISMNARFSFINDHNWREGDQIRLMSFDEETEAAFHELQPYFEARMDYFKDAKVSLAELAAFDAQWNKDNPGNPVTTGTDGNVKGFIPRLTKDDNILSLTLRKK